MRIVLPLTFAFCVLAIAAQSQGFERLNVRELRTAADCKEAEPAVLMCANYNLTHPMDGADEKRKSANHLIVMWMRVTPDYNFVMDATCEELTKKNEALFALIMSAMAKTALDDPAVAKNANELKLASYKMLLDYCADPANKVELTRNLKKAINANKKGKLKEYLGV
jgi:hypothetical protein